MSPALLSALDDINTEKLYIPVNCTHLAQPLDRLILRQIKAVFRKKCNQKLVQLIQTNDCTNTGRVRNPGKSYYLEVIKEFIEELNNRTHGHISMARKSMMMCELIPDVDGVCRIHQLSMELREIVNSNLQYFHGLHPSQNIE